LQLFHFAEKAAKLPRLSDPEPVVSKLPNPADFDPSSLDDIDLDLLTDMAPPPPASLPIVNHGWFLKHNTDMKPYPVFFGVVDPPMPYNTIPYHVIRYFGENIYIPDELTSPQSISPIPEKPTDTQKRPKTDTLKKKKGSRERPSSPSEYSEDNDSSADELEVDKRVLESMLEEEEDEEEVVEKEAEEEVEDEWEIHEEEEEEEEDEYPKHYLIKSCFTGKDEENIFVNDGRMERGYYTPRIYIPAHLPRPSGYKKVPFTDDYGDVCKYVLKFEEDILQGDDVRDFIISDTKKPGFVYSTKGPFRSGSTDRHTWFRKSMSQGDFEVITATRQRVADWYKKADDGEDFVFTA